MMHNPPKRYSTLMRNPLKRHQPSTRNLPKRNQPFHTQSSQTKCVGAVPVCPPERPRSGVSIPKIGLCITHFARGG